MTLLAVMLTAASAWAWSGSGTSEAPYQISSAADLTKFANIVNGTGGETRNQGACAKLIADIAFTPTDAWNLASSVEHNYTPIGSDYSYPFTGTFDGNHHSVSGIRIHTDSDGSIQGLFGAISGSALVKDVTLRNTRITAYRYAGAIVGYNGTVSGCYVAEDVEIHTNHEYQNADLHHHGGVAGYLQDGTITGCFSAALLTIDSSVGNWYNSHGAIVGSVYADGTNSLINNYYSGSVNGVSKGVGIGTNTTACSDATENNGAVAVHTYTLTDATHLSVATSADAVLTFDGKGYYSEGTMVTITVTPESGYVLQNLSVVDAGSNTIATGYWYSNNTVAFNLPDCNVTVSAPTFTNDLNEDVPTDLQPSTKR